MERPRPLPDRTSELPEGVNPQPAATSAAGMSAGVPAGGQLPFPYAIDAPDGSVAPLHGDLKGLTDHLLRHIVEPAARKALPIAYPWLRSVDVFTNDAAAERFLSHHAHDPSLDEIARAYTRLVQSAIVEAAALGWTVQVDRLTSVHLDSAGLLVLIGGGTVRTAFIPGVDRVENEISMRHESRNERTAREARERRWTSEERYYYRVFRPAMRTIRRFPASGVRGDAQYGALKRVLPAIADLGFGAWLAMRARLGHGLGDALGDALRHGLTSGSGGELPGPAIAGPGSHT